MNWWAQCLLVLEKSLRRLRSEQEGEVRTRQDIAREAAGQCLCY